MGPALQNLIEEVGEDEARKRIKFGMSSPDGFQYLVSNGMLKCFEHTVDMSDALMRVESGDLQFLMMNLPPQHGKSVLTCHHWPARLLMMNPDLRIIIASYGEDLAKMAGAKNRELVELWGQDLAGIEVDPSTRKKDEWKVKGRRGGIKSVGVGSGLTGFSADIIICDDLFKGPVDSGSPTGRDKVWDWFMSVALTRTQRVPKIVVCGTPWGPDDIFGRLLRNAADDPEAIQWEVIKFPAVKKDGTALCPELHPIEKLSKIKAGMSRFLWQALYMCDPVRSEGHLWDADFFGHPRRIDSWPDETVQALVVAIDPSDGKDRKKGDYSAIVAMGWVPSLGKFVIDCDLKRRPPHELIRDTISFIQNDLPRHPDAVVVETNKDNFLADTLFNELSNHGINSAISRCFKKFSTKNKEVRIEELDPLFVQDRFRYVISKSMSLMIKQLEEFPQGEHDDGPDALKLAVWVFENKHKYDLFLT